MHLLDPHFSGSGPRASLKRLALLLLALAAIAALSGCGDDDQAGTPGGNAGAGVDGKSVEGRSGDTSASNDAGAGGASGASGAGANGGGAGGANGSGGSGGSGGNGNGDSPATGKQKKQKTYKVDDKPLGGIDKGGNTDNNVTAADKQTAGELIGLATGAAKAYIFTPADKKWYSGDMDARFAARDTARKACEYALRKSLEAKTLLGTGGNYADLRTSLLGFGATFNSIYGTLSSEPVDPSVTRAEAAMKRVFTQTRKYGVPVSESVPPKSSL